MEYSNFELFGINICFYISLVEMKLVQFVTKQLGHNDKKIFYLISPKKLYYLFVVNLTPKLLVRPFVQC